MTFSQEFGDGLIVNLLRKEAEVGHRVLIHVLKSRQLHDAADDVIGEGQFQVLHDALHLAPRILGEGTKGGKTESVLHREVFFMSD